MKGTAGLVLFLCCIVAGGAASETTETLDPEKIRRIADSLSRTIQDADIPISTIEDLVTGEGFELHGVRPDIALTVADDSAH